MLSAAARSRLSVVLAGARNPNNIGAAARAMQDFGFSDLRLVNEFAAPFEAAQIEARLEGPLEAKSAVAAQHVMQSARRFDSLAEAIADCTLIAGTTAIGDRQLTQPVATLQQAAPLLLAGLEAGVEAGVEAGLKAFDATLDATPPARVALLFGSEKTGLTREQLSHCSLLTTIPMFAPGAEGGTPARHLSMNLGQSVAVCLYELTRDGFEGAKDVPAMREAPATAQDRELLTKLLLDVMQVTGYSRRFPANSAEPLVRQLVMPLGSTHRQAQSWMGIFRQILWQRDGPSR